MKSIGVFIAVMGLVAGTASAQISGIPIARGAAAGQANDMQVSAGISLGDDLNMYGGRFAFNVMDDVFVFGDLGIVDPDGGDAGLGLQGGGQFTLPLQLEPVDLAVRGSLGYARFDDKEAGIKFETDLITMMAAGVVSMDVHEMVTVYGVLGLAYWRVETKSSSRVAGSSSSSDSETEPVLGVGASVNLTPELSLYAEVLHIDELFLNAGAAYRF